MLLVAKVEDCWHLKLWRLSQKRQRGRRKVMVYRRGDGGRRGSEQTEEYPFKSERI